MPDTPVYEWGELSAYALQSASRLQRRLGKALRADELAQEAVFRLWLASQSDRQIPRPFAWIEGVLRHLVMDEFRAHNRLITSQDLTLFEDEALELPSEAIWSDPERRAVLEDLWSQAPALLERLPPPCRQIATLQNLRGWSRRQVSTWLVSWRPVGEEEVRRLFVRTHRMLRALGSGEDLSEVWKSGGNPKKNPWLTTPPPDQGQTRLLGPGVRLTCSNALVI